MGVQYGILVVKREWCALIVPYITYSGSVSRTSMKEDKILGTYFARTDFDPMIGLVISVVGFVILIIAGFRSKTWLFLLGAVVLTGGVVVSYTGGSQVEANSIVYPVERQSTIPLVKTEDSQGSGFFQPVGSPSAGTVFTVKNADGSYQQIISKRVKVFEDATGDPYVVKQQAVYTHKDVYTPGQTPLCLKDVDSGCRANGVLNTTNPDDDAYELHVPIGTVKIAH